MSTNNEIRIVLEVDRSEPSAKARMAKKKTKEEDYVENTLAVTSEIGAGLPVIGNYVSKFTSVTGKAESFINSVSKGGGTATLAIAGLATAVVSRAYEEIRTYLINQRQSEELQRRAGYRRDSR